MRLRPFLVRALPAAAALALAMPSTATAVPEAPAAAAAAVTTAWPDGSLGPGGNSLPTGGDMVIVTNPGNQSGTVGTPIPAFQIQASDSAAGQSLTYSAVSLPPGLSISSSGLVSGTPIVAGGFTTTVTAKDATGASGSATFDWSISGTGGFHVTYVRTAQWPGGFMANVTITNTGTDPVNGWTLAFSFPGDQRITSGWNATITQTGQAVSATNAAYDASVPPGGSVQFGFQGTYTSNDSPPTAFTVNGIPAS